MWITLLPSFTPRQPFQQVSAACVRETVEEQSVSCPPAKPMSPCSPMFRREAVTQHILSADGTRAQIPGIVQMLEETIDLSMQISNI